MTGQKPPYPPPGRAPPYDGNAPQYDPRRGGHPHAPPPGPPGGDPRFDPVYAHELQHGHYDDRPSRRRQRRAAAPGLSLGSGLFYGVLGLVALAAGAVAFLVFALPTDLVRDQIISEVKSRTGRDLTITGSTSFSIYPRIGVTLSGVMLSGIPGAAGKPLVKMKSLNVSVGLLPLLRQEVKVNRLLLREPHFTLEVDGQGRKSWKFASLWRKTAHPVRLAQATGGTLSDAAQPGTARPSAGGGAQSFSRELSLDDVRIENGALDYIDQRAGTREELRAIDATVGLKSIAAPLTAKGSVVYKAKPIEFDTELTSLKAVLEERPAKLALALNGADLQMRFQGTASFVNAFDADGSLEAKSPSVRGLAQWLGVTLSPSRGFGPLTVDSGVRSAGQTITFTNAKISLDGATANGQISVTRTGARPLVKANLAISELNLNTYDVTGGSESAPRAAPAPSKSGGGPALTIDDLLERDKRNAGPQVRGYTRRRGWSEEAIELASLQLVDADARLSLGRLVMADMKAGQSELTFKLRNGVLKTTLEDVRLYEGRARGFVTIDASSVKIANVGANLVFEGISAQPLLKDAAQLDWLAGKGRVSLALAGQGRTQRQIVGTLNGKVDFNFTDGAIVGINIPQMVRGLGQVGTGGGSAVEKTDFSEFSSTWAVSGGVGENNDLKLISPLLRVGGSGRVSLPAKEIDYTLRPKLVSSLAGQGGDANLKGIEIPVRVHGPWENPTIAPDVAGVLEDPNKAVDTIREIGKKFKGKDANEIVEGLFGKGGDKESGSSGSDAAKKLFEKLF
jgi:AsmA protein